MTGATNVESESFFFKSKRYSSFTRLSYARGVGAPSGHLDWLAAQSLRLAGEVRCHSLGLCRYRSPLKPRGRSQHRRALGTRANRDAQRPKPESTEFEEREVFCVRD